MGFSVSLFFRRRYYRKVDNAINHVKHGVYNRLKARYLKFYGDDAAGYLAAAVANELFSEKPSNEAAAEFLRDNTALVEKEVKALREDEEIPRIVTHALKARMKILSKTQISGAYDRNIGRPLHKLRKTGLLPGNDEEPPRSVFLRTARRFYETSLKR